MKTKEYRAPSLAFVIGFAALTATAQERQDIRDICGNCRVELYAECGGFLEGATFDRSGRLWAVDLTGGNILRIDEGECIVEGNTGGQPNGARFHRDGRLFIADKMRGVLAFNPADDSLEVVAELYRAEKIRGTNDLVFDSNGGLYFTEPYGSNALKTDGRVFYLPPGDGARLEVFSDGLAFPNGIALSADEQYVFIGEYAKKRILSVPSQSSTSDFEIPYVYTHTEGGVGPDGIAFDEAGNLYAAIFQGGEIRVTDSDRFHIGSIALPEGAGTFVTNLAFSGGYLYLTEASTGTIYRVATEIPGLPYFHQR